MHTCCSPSHNLVRVDWVCYRWYQIQVTALEPTWDQREVRNHEDG